MNFSYYFFGCSKSQKVSHFLKNLTELNQKESPRLKWGSKILNLMGIKTKLKNNSIKIFGNPNIQIKKR